MPDSARRVSSVTSVSLFVVFLCALLAGCAYEPLPPPAWAIAGNIQKAEKKRSADDALTEALPGAPSNEQREVLVQWDVIDGGNVGGKYSGVQHVRFKNPVAAAGRGDYLYIADRGARQLYLLNRATEQLSVVGRVWDYISNDVGDIYVAADLSFYITDTTGGRVLYFDKQGNLIRIFEDKLNLSQAVGVTVDDARGYVFVGDSAYDYVVVFNLLGGILEAIGTRGDKPGEIRGLTAVTAGPDGLYVGARLSERAQVFGMDGSYLYSLQRETVVFPTAIVVDEDNRVYISDYMDNTIKVYRDGLLVSTYGGTGNAPGRFKRITDMWLDEGYLYVTDSLNRRIQVLRIVPDDMSLSMR
ncbi:MAG: hypothetical protein GXP10_04180 [Gammaproteobacteria bacterium]|nr:hypothetical protein [Gammaproteobacteria bacterium]